MPTKLSPRLVSRVSVHVVLRERISTSPDCKAVNRCCAVNGVKRIFRASPNSAAATARQRSTSMPRHSPLLSGCEKPARPVFTPHCRKPFLRAESAVAPAWAPSATTSKSTSASIHKVVLTSITLSLRQRQQSPSVLVRLSIFRYERTGKSRRQCSREKWAQEGTAQESYR